MKIPNLHSFLHRRSDNHALGCVILLQSLHLGR